MKLAGWTLSHRAASGRLTAAGPSAGAALRIAILALTLAWPRPLAVTRVAAALTVIFAAGPGIAVSRGEPNLELVELVPLLFGALAVGNCQQLLEPPSRRNRLRWCVHPHIIPLFAFRWPIGRRPAGRPHRRLGVRTAG